MKEEDFKQFIEFGQLFDRPTRRFLVNYLIDKFQPRELAAFTHEDPAFDHLRRALDRIFEPTRTRQVLTHHDALATQVLQDTLHWLRKTHQQIETENPFQDEFRRLRSWQDRPLRILAETWYHLTNFLKETYRRDELDVLFYEERFDKTFRDLKAFQQQLDNSPGARHPIEPLIEDLLQQWEALLLARSLQYQVERMEEERAQFAELLHTKVDEFQKMLDLIAPFTLDVGRFWDLEKGTLRKNTFDILERYAQILENERNIRELADMLGRWREAETELEETTYERVIAKTRYREYEGLRGEIGGIHESDDLNTLLPAEAALLGTSVTETLFYKKYAERKLLTFQYKARKAERGQDRLLEKQAQARSKARGPFIICVDTSGSMEGTPEQIAKVLCFAVLKMAARERRHAYLISFAVGLSTINLLELETSLDKVVSFLNMRFDGGTDISPALYEALRMLETQEYEEADVLMVSDFVMYDIKDAIVAQMKKKQKNGTRFHSLTIAGSATNPDIVELFDNYWVYDPASKDILRQMVTDVRGLRSVSEFN